MADNFDKLQFEVNAIDNASKVLNNIAQSLQKIKGTSSGTDALTQSTKNLETQQKKTTSSTNIFKSTLGKLTAVTVLARQTARAFMGIVKESSAFVENLNLFAVTFGDTYQETLDWSLEIADNFGLASNEVVRFTGLFKQLSTSIGVFGETGDDVSQVLTQLGYDKFVA